METKKKNKLEFNFKLPEGIKRLEECCPDCGMQFYEIKGKKVCGECKLISTNEQFLRKVQKHCTGNTSLEDHRQEIINRRKKKEPVKDYKSRQYPD